MFDFARTRTLLSPSRFAVAITIRGSATNAIDPVTRSTGSLSPEDFDRCEIPNTAMRCWLAKSTSGCSDRLTSAFLWPSPLTAATIGSAISSLTPPTSVIAWESRSMSVDALKWCSSPAISVARKIRIRVRSAPAANSLGMMVSAGSSSADHMTTLPIGAIDPSGQRPPTVMVAASWNAIVLLPVPGAPARTWSFPRASQFCHSQLMGSGVISCPSVSCTRAFRPPRFIAAPRSRLAQAKFAQPRLKAVHGPAPRADGRERGRRRPQALRSNQQATTAS